jgi:hypothetical protein
METQRDAITDRSPKNLDCEQLSESDSKDTEARITTEAPVNCSNHIYTCYEKIQRRKTRKRIKWHNTLINGIIFIEGKELLFNRASMDLILDLGSDKDENMDPNRVKKK